MVLGDIQPDLHAGGSSLQWLVNAHTLAFATAARPVGAISDEFARKLVTVWGITLSCIGSVICATPDSA